MLFDWRKGGAAAFQIVDANMMEVERRPMVDEPELFVPPQHIGIARRSIHIGDIGVKPDDRGGQFGNDQPSIEGIKGDGSRQEIHAQVEAPTTLDQRANLIVWLGATKYRIKLHEDNFWHRQSQCATNLTGYQFRDQRFRPLTRSPKFEHIEPIVICFNDSRE